jgi:hypothetical protein
MGGNGNLNIFTGMIKRMNQREYNPGKQQQFFKYVILNKLFIK